MIVFKLYERLCLNNFKKQMIVLTLYNMYF